MSSRQLIVLGTASQAPTRYRSHNAFALRWDDQLVLFDPGEGTQRQCTLAGVAIARATGVCITHFHGDHSLGLPGVIQRRALDARSRQGGLPELPVFYPSDGEHYFERLRSATIFHDTSNVVGRPVEASAASEPAYIATLGKLDLLAAPLMHRVTTYGYRLQAPPHRTMLPDRLHQAGIAGPEVGQLIDQGWLETSDGRRVDLDEVSEVRPGKAMAFIMDTVPCAAALRLAKDVDLLVCESTYLHEEAELADRYGHMTARQAAELAVEAGARRLVLGHFSARYPTTEAFQAEAGAIHNDVVIAHDLLTVDVP